MKQLILCCILVAACNHSGSARSSGGSGSSSNTSAPADVPSDAKECNIPSSWTKMDAGFSPPADEIVVLDWRARTDAQGSVTEDALVWYRGHDDAAAYWFLTTLYRHPKDENSWHLAVVNDAPIVPQLRFDHAPNNAELSDFLQHTTWSWHREGATDTAGQRCDAAWTRVIGSPPPH